MEASASRFVQQVESRAARPRYGRRRGSALMERARSLASRSTSRSRSRPTSCSWAAPCSCCSGRRGGPRVAAHQRAVGTAIASCSPSSTGAAVWWYLLRGLHGGRRPIAVDGFRWMADLVILLGDGLRASRSSMRRQRPRRASARPSRTCSCCSRPSGMMLLAAARDLMIVFLGVELMSIAVYVLAGMNRRSARAAEGALKYFLLGAFSTRVPAVRHRARVRRHRDRRT